MNLKTRFLCLINLILITNLLGLSAHSDEIQSSEVSNVVVQDNCKIIYDLSASLNRKTRNIPLETLLSLLALGTGRSSDFIKYLEDKKNVNIGKLLADQKYINRELSAIESEIKKNKKMIKKAGKSFEYDSVDTRIYNLIEDSKEEILTLENQHKILKGTIENLEKDISAESLAKQKISTPFWPLKFLQIIFASGIIIHETILCEQGSLSCVIDQLIDLMMPIPITSVGDATLTARYEAVPALIIFDLDRNVISKEDACLIVKDSKKLIQDFDLIKIINQEMHPEMHIEIH